MTNIKQCSIAANGGYLDLLNQIMVKYGQFVNDIYKVDSRVDPSIDKHVEFLQPEEGESRGPVKVVAQGLALVGIVGWLLSRKLYTIKEINAKMKSVPRS